ncbi:PQQ-dependent sugar dehydrogenase [Virgibacillus doumboii]|uniref:PQQ-dependent sugar dehydrogenase n=1 Tax=Virgibacillus doumboii TaxID=2697503 RepID=UPI0013DFD701|nr:PQQ-dependent sugar dehydrogenase [Virgibacillus doumboii]
MTITIVLGACVQQETPEQEADQTLQEDTDSEKQLEVIAEDLKEPWEIVKTGDTFYISERRGSIVKIQDGKKTRMPVQFSEDLSNQPEAGLLGIAFPENFNETSTGYAYYSYQENENYYQRVVKIQSQNDKWKETATLLDKIPGGQFHQGGRIEIGPDNKLYITTGDATNPELSQDLNSLAGKILRMNPDGTIPEDNPFENSYVYSYGHRNPQGLAWNEDNQLYATEHGSSAHDEINRIIKGRNYGWPAIRGDESAPQMKTPIIHSGNDTWAPSGMTYFNSNFYFASLAGEGLRQFDPEKESQTRIISDVGRVRDALATDKGIYFITNNTDGRGTPAENDDRLLFLLQQELN